MAVPIVIQTVDEFELEDPSAGSATPSKLVAQLGVWSDDSGTHSGIVINTLGEIAPALWPDEARKFAKWLQRAAAEMDGSRSKDKRMGRRKRRHYDTDGDEYDR
jgi:hypothetical protein